MRAYIHGFQGRPWNHECRVAAYGFRDLGIRSVLFTTNEEFDTRKPEDIVVGGNLIIWHALNQRGISPGHHDYPQELMTYCGRRIKRMLLKDLGKETFPVFIKPVEEKSAPGIVENSFDSLGEYTRVEPETEIYCSEVVHFISEWRCFLLYGRIIGIRFYFGDPDVECDRNTIESAVKEFSEIPAGCALDFGVTDEGKTLLIEMNDGYSLGVYGLEPVLYARLLAARWAELNGTEDIFRNLPIEC